VAFSYVKGAPVGTNVYIDGFNLYNGSVKNTQFKWLDLGALCATLLQGPADDAPAYALSNRPDGHTLPHLPSSRTVS